SLQSFSRGGGGTDFGEKLRPRSQMVTRSSPPPDSNATPMEPAAPAYPCSMMFVQASSTASLRSKQAEESVPVFAHGSSMKSRIPRRCSSRASTEISARMVLLDLWPPGKERLDLAEQARQLHGLGVEIVAAEGPRLGFVLRHGVRREADD